MCISFVYNECLLQVKEADLKATLESGGSFVWDLSLPRNPEGDHQISLLDTCIILLLSVGLVADMLSVLLLWVGCSYGVVPTVVPGCVVSCRCSQGIWICYIHYERSCRKCHQDNKWQGGSSCNSYVPHLCCMVITPSSPVS